MASLEAKHSALETVYKLSYALDALNYHDLAQVLPSNGTFNFDIFAILKTPAKDVTAEEYFKIAKGGLGGFDHTQHLLSNPIVDVDGSTAHVKVMVTALHALNKERDGFDSVTARVTWSFELKNEGGDRKWVVHRWKIEELVPLDDPTLMGVAHGRVRDGKLRSSIVAPWI